MNPKEKKKNKKNKKVISQKTPIARSKSVFETERSETESEKKARLREIERRQAAIKRNSINKEKESNIPKATSAKPLTRNTPKNQTHTDSIGVPKNMQTKQDRISQTIDITSSEIVDVYVYYQLTNKCTVQHHPIESVTAITLDANTRKKIQVNVFHCKTCNSFFINYEALKKYISNGKFPSFRYILVRPNDLKLNDVSELGLYGYSVRQGGLNQEQRHKLLAWIIESRLMKKQDIIKALEFKIHYNGKKSGNETACLKWENDLHFVSTYTADNTHSIRAKFR